MDHFACWVIENGAFRPCPSPASEFSSLAVLHTHSRFSTENLASLNWVAELPYMRPLKGLLKRSFGLGDVPEVDYRQMCYTPPYEPDDIWRMEKESAGRLGFDRVLLSLTDHDEVAGGLQLLDRLPDQHGRIGIGEELSIRFEGYLFHLGVSGLPQAGLIEAHASLQQAAREGRLDAVFDRLHALGCLVVLNHPLLAWNGDDAEPVPVLDLLARYGWAIHALEFNGMRSFSENQRVIQLAGRVGKPLVGGGDSHLLRASAALSASRASSYADFVAEVKSGWSRPLVKREYLRSHRWKLTLRVLSFIAQYRRVASYRGEPVAEMLAGRTVLLDPIGVAARGVLTLADRFGRLA